ARELPGGLQDLHAGEQRGVQPGVRERPPARHARAGAVGPGAHRRGRTPSAAVGLSDGRGGHRGAVDSQSVSLSIGIVGLPNVGKSTLFNALTKNTALAANYPFATIEPNVGVVAVPDPRLDELARLYDSAKIVPATMQFVDIAGIVKGASEGQGLGNQFLANIRETDAICQVIRVFDDADVTHVDGEVEPLRDIETINTELILADLQTLEKARPRLDKEAGTRKDKEKLAVVEAAHNAQKVLNDGTTLYASGLDLDPLRELHLLTAKPFLYVFNVDEDELGDTELRARL